MDNRNLSETLPYGKLAMLGIDREKADLLPQEVKEKLLSGEVTPLMQVSHPCAERQCCHAAAQTPDGLLICDFSMKILNISSFFKVELV